MKTALFDYPLPDELIAQFPAERRDASRLLVVDRRARSVEHRTFRDLPELIGDGNCLFRNNASVIPARLHAQRPTGGQVECLLLRPARDPGDWLCLLRPGRKLPVGATFANPGFFDATVRERGDDGVCVVRFATDSGRSILDVADECGEVPLPPYITAERSPDLKRADRERYATVFASREKRVAVAAPTAGLHFTPELLARVAEKGNEFADLTLHVGLGTFKPMQTDDVEEHAIHREVYEIPAATQARLFDRAHRRIAVGTTSVRTIEDFLARHAAQGADWIGDADLFIHPPRDFRGVDALITNFHAPRSTLLCLVASFLAPGSTDGVEWLREIYAGAVAERYRFLSYGDAMLIL
ncbi:MAG TPA: tRNA preQ1(34) S-adenosylmethionine ribosyltransferase-isomerase QueA [Opitutaceae bacterium]|nr:tRNA preQ1(34) S-adenosylmethionine ribosyltransferase-isomerase QueA [Opitutaceae bacterium]